MPIKPNLAEVPNPKYVLTYPKYGSVKLDGVRGGTQEGTLLSRSLKAIPNKALRALLSPFQGLDGELIYGEPNDPLVYNKTVSEVMRIDGGIAGAKYFVFDTLDLTKPYEERLADLQAMSFPDFIVKLPQTLLTSEDEVTRFYEENLELGYEGAILRNPKAMYKQGRSTAISQDMLKFKPFMDSEAEVLEVLEGYVNNNEVFTNELGRTARSKHQENMEPNGMVGKFLVRVGDKVFKISAGKTSHRERKSIFDNRDQYIGKIATFRHLPIGEKDFPRSGRFIHWRDPIDMGE